MYMYAASNHHVRLKLLSVLHVKLFFEEKGRLILLIIIGSQKTST